MANVLQLRSLPIENVRIALIGLGNRGIRTIQRYSYIEGARITAIADIYEERIEEGLKCLQQFQTEKVDSFIGEDSWKSICEKSNVDLVIICTDWNSHTEIACYAMTCNKHVAIEVPAATTIEDCHKLVAKAEETQRHCIMLENCCYDYFHLSTSHLIEKGEIGTIKHCEGAYLHYLDKYFEDTGSKQRHNWMTDYCSKHIGNAYPTHGIGPIAHLLNIHRGNRFDYLVSVASVKDNKPVNTTLIKTTNGETILLQLDIFTPRPYSRLQTICGTNGFIQKYPTPTLQLLNNSFLTDKAAEAYIQEHPHPIFAKIQEQGREKKVPNLMNYLMDYRMINSLRKGLPMDIDVYDAAEWSAIAELSEQSARNGSTPISFPDFTHGHSNDINEHHYW